MSVGIGNVEFNIKPKKQGERIVIYGAGIIGQSFIQAFKAETDNCEIAVVDTSDYRLKLAKQSGADYVINPERERSYEKIADIWGYGQYAYHDKETMPCGNATIAVECTGNPICVGEAMDIVTANGKVCYAAGYPDSLTAQVHPVNFMHKNISIIPGMMGDFKKSVEYMSKGIFDTRHLVSHIYPLEELETAMKTAMNPKESCKVCIKVDRNAEDYMLPLIG